MTHFLVPLRAVALAFALESRADTEYLECQFCCFAQVVEQASVRFGIPPSLNWVWHEHFSFWHPPASMDT